MKKLTFAVMIFLAPLSMAYGERKPVNTLTLEAAQKQAYWYSLYNVAHLTMFSGMGKIMKGGGMIGIIDWLKGGGVQRAELVKDMYMISSVYAEGDPHFIQPVSLDNKRSMAWDQEKVDKTLDPSAQAFTIIKSLAKNFHRDYHETKDNQRVAIAMYPEAKEMAKLLAEKMTDEKGHFVSISPEGRKGRPLAFDQVTVLWAFSDLALISSDLEVPPYNDSEIAKWSTKMADKAFENALVISGMQQASGISLVEPLYLKREPEIHFAHPALPLPEKAGGRFGKAPVYAAEVTYQNGQWKVTDQRFRTKDAMFLASMSVLLNRHQVDSFIPLERLTSKLSADMGL